jgi:hypothetical protein
MPAFERSIDPYGSYGAIRGWTGASQPTGADTAMFHLVLGAGLEPGMRLLDIGFGDGKLLNWAKSQGLLVSGVERQASLIAGARAAGFEADSSVDAFPDQAFDILTAFDVLEHIESESILPLLRSWVAKLRYGGTLIVRIPNSQVPAGLAIQFSDHTHVTPLSEPIVRWLFANCGLDVTAAYGAPETIGSDAHWHERWQFLLLPLRQLVRRMMLRMIGLPKDVLIAHNLVVIGTRQEPPRSHHGL